MTAWIKARALWLVLAVAILVRVAAALYLGDPVEALPGTHDQISYDALAQSVAAGRGFTFDSNWYPFTRAHTPTAHWSFLYTLYLAGVYRAVGHHPVVARLIQAAVVGALIPWLVYRLGKRTFGGALGESVGMGSAAAIAVYIYLVYYSATLMTESFYIVALLWALDALQRMQQSALKKVGLALELGAAWGIATLLRQQVLLLVPFFLVWLTWTTWGRVRFRRVVALAAVSLGIVAACILPWTVRNWTVYHRFLPLNSNVGYALYAANHPQQGNRFEPSNLAPVPAEWRGMNEAELNDRLLAAAIGFVIDQPGRFALQTLDRFRNYFRFWPEPTSSTIANASRVLSFGLYLPFMVYGLWLSLRWLSTASDRACLVVLYLYVAVYSAIHLLSWAMHRYRLPVDAVMMVLVGLAWGDLYRRVRGRLSALQPRTL